MRLSLCVHLFDLLVFLSQLNSDLQNVMKDLQAQHPDQVFAVKGLQRRVDFPVPCIYTETSLITHNDKYTPSHHISGMAL